MPARETVAAMSALKKHGVLLGELAARLALDISLRLKLLKAELIMARVNRIGRIRYWRPLATLHLRTGSARGWAQEPRLL